MHHQRLDRRRALKTSLAWAGAAIWTGRDRRAFGFQNANDRPRVAAVGTGSRWSQRATGIDRPYGSAQEMRKFGDYVAVCDADADRVDRGKSLAQDWSGIAAVTSADYRAVIDRDDIDIVHISTPDHWHAKIAIEAMLSGKDVYCEKPMTLTIDEGRQMCDVCKRTGRIVQIGTQQRSNQNFIKAIALIRDGRIGQLQASHLQRRGRTDQPADFQRSIRQNILTGIFGSDPRRCARFVIWQETTGKRKVGHVVITSSVGGTNTPAAS